MNINQRLNLIKQVGEEIVTEEELKTFIKETVGKFNNQPHFKSVRVVIDVDFYWWNSSTLKPFI